MYLSARDQEAEQQRHDSQGQGGHADQVDSPGPSPGDRLRAVARVVSDEKASGQATAAVVVARRAIVWSVWWSSELWRTRSATQTTAASPDRFHASTVRS